MSASAMTASGLFAVGVGAVLGAWLRWGLGLAFNATHPSIPVGTLAANLVGGYLIGLAVAYFAQSPSLAPEWRLFVITGFLGALTTFSTFSAENVHLIQGGQIVAALAHSGLHLAGSIVATFAGIATYRALA